MDKFSGNIDTASNPARGLALVAPADGAELSQVPKALFVGSGGDLRVRCIEDEAPITLKNVGNGQILPVRAIQVYASGTTAADIVALL